MPASHYKRKVKKNVDRNNRGRFRTQPVTFMEIKVRVQKGWDEFSLDGYPFLQGRIPKNLSNPKYIWGWL